MDLSHNGGITHLYFDGPVVFPFGFGLTGYTKFTFAPFGASAAPPRVSRALLQRGGADAPFPAAARVAVAIENVGAVASDAVALAVLRRAAAAGGGGGIAAAAPRQALVGFHRERDVAPGERRVHTFPLTVGAVFGAFRGAGGAIEPPLGAYELAVEGAVALAFEVTP